MVVEEIRVINTKEISFENPAEVVGQKLEVVYFGSLCDSFASEFFSFAISPFLCRLGEQSAVLEKARKGC